MYLPNTLTIEGDVKELARSLKLLLYVASYVYSVVKIIRQVISKHIGILLHDT